MVKKSLVCIILVLSGFLLYSSNPVYIKCRFEQHYYGPTKPPMKFVHCFIQKCDTFRAAEADLIEINGERLYHIPKSSWGYTLKKPGIFLSPFVIKVQLKDGSLIYGRDNGPRFSIRVITPSYRSTFFYGDKITVRWEYSDRVIRPAIVFAYYFKRGERASTTLFYKKIYTTQVSLDSSRWGLRLPALVFVEIVSIDSKRKPSYKAPEGRVCRFKTEFTGVTRFMFLLKERPRNLRDIHK